MSDQFSFITSILPNSKEGTTQQIQMCDKFTFYNHLLYHISMQRQEFYYTLFLKKQTIRKQNVVNVPLWVVKFLPLHDKMRAIVFTCNFSLFRLPLPPALKKKKSNDEAHDNTKTCEGFFLLKKKDETGYHLPSITAESMQVTPSWIVPYLQPSWQNQERVSAF